MKIKMQMNFHSFMEEIFICFKLNELIINSNHAKTIKSASEREKEEEKQSFSNYFELICRYHIRKRKSKLSDIHKTCMEMNGIGRWLIGLLARLSLLTKQTTKRNTKNLNKNIES